jgi:iron complex outermembrane receptor protein
VKRASDFIFLLNAKPVPGNAASILNQMPAHAINKVEVITAPSANYDPEEKASILKIFTKKGTINGTFTQVNVKARFPSIEDYDNC